jgi:molybdopterin molybdotransferase
MTQLSDDCFALGAPVMSVDEAVAIIATRVSAVDGMRGRFAGDGS